MSERVLGDLAELTVGHVGLMASEYVEEGIPFLRSLNVQPFRVDLSEMKFISPEFHSKLRKSALHPGDVIVVRTGAPGTAAVVPESLPVSNCSDVVIVRPGPELDSRYLAYLINSVARGYIDSQTVGAVQQHFNVGAAKGIPIPAVSLNEQRRIASVLGVLDDLIETNRAAIADLRALALAIFESASREGEVVPFEEIGTQVRDGVPSSGLAAGTPYLGLEHFGTGGVGLIGVGDVSTVESNKSRFKAGDVLFGKLRPYFRKFDRPGFDGVCSTEVWVLRPKPGWGAATLNAVVSRPEFTEFSVAGSGGTRMPRANWQHVGTMPAMVPPHEMRLILDRQLDELWRAAVDLREEIGDVTRARDGLLPLLMSGRVRVADLEAA